jgi:uncharacterized membrane protein (UPF0136 family)
MVVVGVFIVYGLLLFVDAAVGYSRTGGKPILIAGICSGIAAIAAGVLMHFAVPIGASIGIGVLLAMLAVFASRYMRVRDFVPSGLMLLASLVALGAIVRSMR